MKLDRRFKIERCAPQAPELREHLQDMIVDHRGKFLLATNGNILARVPVAIERGDSKHCKTVTKLELARARDGDCGELDIVLKGKREPFMPIAKLRKMASDKKIKASISLDVELLRRVADAFGDARLTIGITDSDDAAVVTLYAWAGDKKREPLALVMPLMSQAAKERIIQRAAASIKPSKCVTKKRTRKL